MRERADQNGLFRGSRHSLGADYRWNGFVCLGVCANVEKIIADKWRMSSAPGNHLSNPAGMVLFVYTGTIGCLCRSIHREKVDEAKASFFCLRLLKITKE